LGPKLLNYHCSSKYHPSNFGRTNFSFKLL